MTITAASRPANPVVRPAFTPASRVRAQAQPVPQDTRVPAQAASKLSPRNELLLIGAVSSAGAYLIGRLSFPGAWIVGSALGCLVTGVSALVLRKRQSS